MLSEWPTYVDSGGGASGTCCCSNSAGTSSYCYFDPSGSSFTLSADIEMFARVS